MIEKWKRAPGTGTRLAMVQYRRDGVENGLEILDFLQQRGIEVTLSGVDAECASFKFASPSPRVNLCLTQGVFRLKNNEYFGMWLDGPNEGGVFHLDGPLNETWEFWEYHSDKPVVEKKSLLAWVRCD